MALPPSEITDYEVPAEALVEITELYESGLYVQACAEAEKLGPVVQWKGTAACLIAGRLAENVFAPRLGRMLHARAWRNDKASPEAALYFGYSLLRRRGPLAAWKFLQALPSFPDDFAGRLADLLMLKARIAGMFRDFERAKQLMAEAEAIAADRPWFWVEKSSLASQRDAYDEALESIRHGLELQPDFRPAVQAAGELLQLLGRDEDALEMLRHATTRLESPAVASQIALLETELGQYRDALASWERVRTLSPWMEPKIVEWWESRISDASYFIGDHARAAEAAIRSANPFHKKIAERLRAPLPEAKRVLLPVGFVRQHHMTCAPATLSALSRYWKMPVDHLTLAAAICYDGTPDHIERHWAEENGWHVREFSVTWDVLIALLDRGIPFTVTTVETQSAHLQAVIGYDTFRGTLLIRDPYERTHGEWLGAEFLERYAASGPRGMLLIPPSETDRLDGIVLPDALLYDQYYRIQRALHGYDRSVAEAHFEEMEKSDASHRLTLRAAWALAAYDGSLPRQLSSVEALLERYPDNGFYLWSKLGLLSRLSRRTERREFLRELNARKFGEVVFWREWAEDLRQDARRWKEAHRHLLRALRFQPLDPDNLYSFANLHWDRREFVVAAELYRFAASLRDKVESYSRSYFIAARHLRQTDDALQILTHRFEAFGEKSSEPIRLLFWALSSLGCQHLAFEKLEAALRLRPEDGDLLLFAADVCARYNQIERGAELLRAAESRASRTAWLRTSAKLADYRCDLTTALACWQEIIKAEPLDVEAQRAVARLLGETQGRDAALAHLRAICDRFDHHVELHELWVEWARAKGNAEAEPVLRRLLKLHPDHAWAHRELALVLDSLHRPEEAMAELDQAALLEPQAPATHAVRAHVAHQAGRLEEARECARTALLLSIDYEPAIRTLLAASHDFAEKRAAISFIREQLISQVVFGDGLLAYRTAAFDISEPPALLASLREALEARPDLWHAWSATIVQLTDMHQLDEALSLAREATERFPLLPRLWVDLAQVYQARRERESEIAPLERALSLSPASSRTAQLLANTYERMGNYAEAARVLERAVAAAPLDPYNYGCLAGVLMHLNRSEEALAHLEHALTLDPGYAWAWSALRAQSAGKGEENRATILARQLAQLRPGEARSWLLLAQNLPHAPLAERLQALDRAVALNPRYTEAHDLRAVVLSDARRYDEALAACAPPGYGADVPVFLRGRAAWVQASRGRTRVAITTMREVVESAPDYYGGWNMLTDWHCADNDFAAAEETAKKMARLAPRSAIPLGYLAEIQHRNKQVKEAFATLERAYEIDPTYAFAGFTLFDHYLGTHKLKEAGKLIETIETHLPGPRAAAAKVRLLARNDKKDAAFAALRDLLRLSQADAAALQSAVDALVSSRWSRETEDTLLNVLHLPETNPEAGALWVRRFAARGGWGNRKRLFDLKVETEIGRRARTAYIEELARYRRLGLLRRFVNREKAWLRKSATAWGSIGYAYVHLRRWRDASRWMQDWPRREDLAPWMLVNIATAYRQLGNDRAALAANQRALELPPDGTIAQHQLWLAYDAGAAGRMAVVDHYLAEIREHTLCSYELALLALVKALRSIHTAPPSERRKVFAENRANLVKLYRQGAYLDKALLRARRQTLDVLSRVSGDPWRWLRPWVPESISRPVPRAAQRKRAFPPGAIFFIVMILSGLLRTCHLDDERKASTLPVPHYTPVPAQHYPMPTVTLDRPVTIQISPPGFGTPIPLVFPKATPGR